MLNEQLTGPTPFSRIDQPGLARRTGVHRVRVFGSAARGEADELSDIDLLVDMPADSILFDQAALQLEVQEVLGCRVDVLTERGLKPRIRERVIKEAALR